MSNRQWNEQKNNKGKTIDGRGRGDLKARPQEKYLSGHSPGKKFRKAFLRKKMQLNVGNEPTLWYARDKHCMYSRTPPNEHSAQANTPLQWTILAGPKLFSY